MANPGRAMDMCRVTVVGPRRRADIALPAHVPFADMLPTVAHAAGLDQVAQVHRGGWVLQRLGQAAFHPATTPQQAGLHDGELIYLRPRQAQLPEIAFDDVPDAIANWVKDRPDRWGPEMTRRVALGAGAAGLLAGLAVLLLSGPPWVIPAAAAGVIAALLLAAAAAMSRAAGDLGAGAVLGYVALPYAFACGLLIPARSHALGHLSALDVAAGSAALTAAAVIASVAIADGLPVFIGTGAAAVLGLVGFIVVSALGVGFSGAAAVIAAFGLALTPLIPVVAFRMAGMTLPDVPRSADEVRRRLPGVDRMRTLAGTARSDRFVTGVASGLGLLAGVAEVVLASSRAGLATIMCAVLGGALLLRSRIFLGRAQRLWLLVPGYGGLALTAVHASLIVAPQPRMLAAVLLPLLAGAALVIGTGLWVAGHRPSPLWGRAADIADVVLVISLIPLALGVAGLFGYVRGLTG